MSYRDTLVALAEAFAAARGLSLARVSTLVRNDGKFFGNIRDGAGCTMDTYEHCLRWFAKFWPADTPWPEGAERPKQTEPADAAE